MNTANSTWKLTDKILIDRELEERVCQALAPYVVRYRDGDLPFINGYRIDFFSFSKLPWRTNWKWGDNALCVMGDVAESLFVCALIKKRFLHIAKWSDFQKTVNSATEPEEDPAEVATWGDITAIVESLFVKTLAPRALPWAPIQA